MHKPINNIPVIETLELPESETKSSTWIPVTLKASDLEQEDLKSFYSELTFIIRKFLDEKVYDRSLESTTDELVERLQLLKDGKKSKPTLDNDVRKRTKIVRKKKKKFNS